MGRRKKVQEQPAPVQSATQSFKFKVTNLRKEAFPEENLEKTDYEGFAPGDLIVRGSENTIFEIIEIRRDVFTDHQYTKIDAHNKRYGRVMDEKLQNLIEKYKKSGNFGVCVVKYKPVIRGDKIITKPRINSFNELSRFYDNNSRYYVKTDLVSIIRNRDYNISSLDIKIDVLKSKKKTQEKMRNTLQKFMDKRNGVVNTQVELTTSEPTLENFQPMIEISGGDYDPTIVAKLNPDLLRA